MSIKELRSFLEICKEQNMTKAAKNLFISTQGLSKIIKNLENELGILLFIRTPGGMELTDGGRALEKRAREMLRIYEELQDDVSQIKRKENGQVELLSAYTILRLLGPECIVRFRERYPDITLTYKEFPDLLVEQRFRQGEADLAFSVAPFEEGLFHVKPLRFSRINLLVNKDHPLAKRESVSIHDLKGEPLLLENSDFKINHIIKKKCQAAGFEPRIIYETISFSLCMKMCKQGMGITVIVDFIPDDFSSDGLVMIPFNDGVYEWVPCMLTRKGSEPTEAVKLFLDFMFQCSD